MAEFKPINYIADTYLITFSAPLTSGLNTPSYKQVYLGTFPIVDYLVNLKLENARW